MSTPQPQGTARTSVKRSLVGLLIVLGVTMLSGTIVSVALPQIVGSLQGTQSQYTWVVTATLLASTASTPVWGRLADLFDKKLLLQISIVLFIVASLLCGFAQNTGQLIAFRAVQGLGMGASQVLVQVIIGALVSPKERGRLNGLIGSVMAVATVGGPLIGGALTDTPWLGWRWCFFVGVPFMLVALVVLARTLHLVDARVPGTRVDYVGATLIAAGVSTLLLWVTFVGGSFAWLSWQTAAMVLGGLTLLTLAVWVESRVGQPVIPLHLVTRRETAIAILASVAVGMAMFGGAVFLGQYFQLARGYSPTAAGLLTTPLMLGTMGASTVAGWMVSRSGRVKPYVLTGLVVLTVGFLALSTIDATTPLPVVSLGMLAVGVGVGMSMQNLVLVVQNSVPLHELGAASGSVTFFRSLGGTIGVSVLGAILAHRVSDDIAAGLSSSGVPIPEGATDGSTLDLAGMPPFLRTIVENAYGAATGDLFLVATGIAVVGLAVAFFLPDVRLRDTIDLPDTEREDTLPVQERDDASSDAAERAVDGAPTGDDAPAPDTPERDASPRSRT
ncbi:MDR family MFS transporter [Nocardiopsis sp. MG754419]|uniref:MDR family MFS transporter n=1 Tax=Nocardiopsis sp. MG754419 TaxID=2259865 RepID=UPI0020128E7C|nr:MDR family MFS transporter [Nocardiopsis sp. MG754419]MBR8743974.1 EmrB/QacA family drug resistance transporter [Nocardiopsis sp. MG754419]